MRHVFPSNKANVTSTSNNGSVVAQVSIVTSINVVTPLRHTSCKSSIDLATVTSCDGLRRNITFPSSRRLRYVVASRRNRHVVIVTSLRHVVIFVVVVTQSRREWLTFPASRQTCRTFFNFANLKSVPDPTTTLTNNHPPRISKKIYI